jgi:hypothetical protein
MNDDLDVEREIENLALTTSGKFWAFTIGFLADRGCIEMDDFLEEMSDFKDSSPEISALERSVLTLWQAQIAQAGTGREAPREH